ncbi:sensor domain-containing diguanylate cyclase [Pseudocitrobacter faecalis]|uniref:sensor domain-containing diguanylate cyclase n=1 Tax=Pseudocitrobacter faecalis TaxID=1398493 RepID=UPI003B9DFE6E
MSTHSRKLSFTTPIIISFAGILLSFLVIATLVMLNQRKDIIEDYHHINRNFTHNMAVNYMESILREDDYILSRATAFLSNNEQLDNVVNRDPEKGTELMMHLLALMPTVTSISVADPHGNYLRVPQVMASSDSSEFDATKRPWFRAQGDSGLFSRYTQPYTDFFTRETTITMAKPVVSPDGKLKGTLAFHLDLPSMSYTLRQMQSPVSGEFFVVNRNGKAVLHPDTTRLFSNMVPEKLMDQMTNAEGEIHDGKSKTWLYYYSFTNPDWFVIYKVSDRTLADLAHHETVIVAWGFAVAAFVIIVFGLYLRHASRSVLMNIINAIKTGDVNRAPRLEAMLSKAIETNKEREMAYVRQATIDALTGCKNRRAFDRDIAALMNDHQPFALALVDVDNFKSINDTWGHLNGDIVLRNVAREGLQILQPHEISIYRYGGEEFAVIFPATHIDSARTLLENWREKVAQRTWREEGLTVTFSGGLGEWNMESLEQLIVSVDEALYKAKQQGKNRILRTTVS